MAIVARIRNLDFKQFLKLSKVLLTQPLFIVPTLTATRQTVRICNRLFGADHHKNNPANAFRHAFWNYLICERCMRFSNSLEQVITWCKRITDLHEQLSPNFELAKAMDLHNNYIGRILFRKRPENYAEAIEILKLKMGTAIFIKSIAEIESADHNLVFIENEA